MTRCHRILSHLIATLPYPIKPGWDRKNASPDVKRLLLGVLAIVALSQQSTAQIYLNQFTGASACPTNGNTPVMAANATGAAVSRSTITCNSTANVFNSTTLNATATVSNASYIEFSATANAGYRLDVTSVSFFRQGSNSAPNQLEVSYSTDGFGTSTTWGAATVTPTAGTVLTWDMTDFSTATAGTVTFRIYPYGTTRCDLGSPASASGTFRIDDVTINGTVTLTSSTPTISALPASLSGLTYIAGAGPSQEKSFTVSANNLTANLVLTPPTNYQISLSSGSGFVTAPTTISLTPSGGTVASTTVYVRLKAGLSAGNYNAEDISLTSTGATPKTVTNNGTVYSGIFTAGNIAVEVIGDGSTALSSAASQVNVWELNSTTGAVENPFVLPRAGSLPSSAPWNDRRPPGM